AGAAGGMNGATEDCDIELDLGGVAAIADINALDAGGNVLRTSRASFSARTGTTIPALLVAPANLNRFLIGSNYSGTFVGALGGVSPAATGVCRYSINGDVVTLEFPDIIGTSNSTGLGLTGLPADIQPANFRVLLGVAQDNGTP